jgi:quinol monooxygenase YgiN
MVQIALTVVARIDGARSLARALRRSMRDALSARDCVRCHLSIDLIDPETLHYVEEWTSEAALQAEIRLGRFHRLIDVMEEAAEPPMFSVRRMSESNGLQYLSDALGSEVA